MTYVLRNSHFFNKATAFSGPWVVWSLFGAPGEKKIQNQMFLQDLHSFAPLRSQVLQIFRNFFRENFRIFADFCTILLNFCEISAKIDKILTQICKISETRMVQKNANLADLEKC